MIRADLHHHDVEALLLRRTDYGESDLIVTVLTDSLGKIALLARGARKSQRRFGGSLQPFHGLALKVTEPRSGELFHLREAQIKKPRLSLVADLTAMTTAGRALNWVRRALPPQAVERATFASADGFLAQLDENPPKTTLEGEARLGEFGLHLLYQLGWALELRRCIRCGKTCPETSSATLNPELGGIICRSCGGARIRISADVRIAMVAASFGNLEGFAASDASQVLDIVEATLNYHGILDA